jgi:hypothetical protein
MEPDRPAGACDNCAPGGRWARRHGPPGRFSAGRIQSTGNRILCRDGQRRRQRVPSNLPSGLLMARLKAGPVGEQLEPRNFRSLHCCESPEGMPGCAKPGDVTACFRLLLPTTCLPSNREGWPPVMGKTRSHLNFESRPDWFTVLASFRRRAIKSSLGCLTYSRIWCLSRGKHNIWWPKSGTGIE